MLLCLSVTLTGVASAASNPNLARDGGFEAPPVAGEFFDNYASGSHIGPWMVSVATVSLSKGFFQIAEPFAGAQFLSLVDAGTQTPTTPGKVCEQVDHVISGHRYRLVVHLASLYQQTNFKVRLGQRAIGVPVNGTQVPAPTAWQRATLTTVAQSADIALCLSAGVPTAGLTFPLVDGTTVTDLGAA